MVGLEVSRLVGHPGIAGGVRLVESVARKRLPVLPDLLQGVRIVAALVSALEEFGLHLGDQVAFFLAHRFPQGVGLALGEASQLLAEQHDLLLVHGDAVGLGEVFLTSVEVVLDRLLAVLPADKRRDVLQRTRSVQRVHGNEVRKLSGLEVLEVALHAHGLVLENAHGFSALEEFVGGGVVQGEGLRVQLNPAAPFDIAHGVLDDGQGLEPQEVHFEQPGILRDGVVELGADHVAVLGRGDGDELGDVVWRDDHPTGVNAGIANRPFDDPGFFEHFGFQSRAVVNRLDGIDLVEPLLSAELFLKGLVVQFEQLGQGDVGHLL